MPVPTSSSRISLDYVSYLSLESKNRERSRLKEIKPFSEIPGMINVSQDAFLAAFVLMSSLVSVFHTPRHTPSMG